MKSEEREYWSSMPFITIGAVIGLFILLFFRAEYYKYLGGCPFTVYFFPNKSCFDLPSSAVLVMGWECFHGWIGRSLRTRGLVFYRHLYCAYSYWHTHILAALPSTARGDTIRNGQQDNPADSLPIKSRMSKVWSPVSELQWNLIPPWLDTS